MEWRTGTWGAAILLLSVALTLTAGREKAAQEPPLRAWLDLSSYLPQGSLRQVALEVDTSGYKHPMMLHIQLWTLIEDSDDSTNYALKWQLPVLLTKTNMPSFTVPVADAVPVGPGDRLGWVSADGLPGVTARFDESFGSLLYTGGAGQQLRVGSNYTFDALVHPRSFALTPSVDTDVTGK